MPYEYRKLSPKEREEIVNYRRVHGYPLHAPPHPFREAGTYLISAANFEHRAIMHSAERRTAFETQLLNSVKEIAKELIAWVILPNHYHILVSIQSLDNVSAALRHLHGTTSHKWNVEDDLRDCFLKAFQYTDDTVHTDFHGKIL
jgi:putative transposase